MKLHRLRLVNFRQHADTEIVFGDGITGIIGPNGSGKTSLLEAIAWAIYGNPAARGDKDSIRNLRAKAQKDFNERKPMTGIGLFNTASALDHVQFVAVEPAIGHVVRLADGHDLPDARQYIGMFILAREAQLLRQELSRDPRVQHEQDAR